MVETLVEISKVIILLKAKKAEVDKDTHESFMKGTPISNLTWQSGYSAGIASAVKMIEENYGENSNRGTS